VVVFELPVPNEKSGVVPVPESASVCGLFAALSVTVSVDCLVPAALGVNVTEIVQVASGAKELGQLFVSAKSPEA
jgi:hypothetical protein